jgi:hypothetical protein
MELVTTGILTDEDDDKKSYSTGEYVVRGVVMGVDDSSLSS